MWALGWILAQCAGFQGKHLEARSQVALVDAWLQDLGPPEVPAFTSLPHYPNSGLARICRPPWPAGVFSVLGTAGVDVLDGLLTYDPARRLTARGVSDSVFLNPERFPLGGILEGGSVPHAPVQAYAGNRHSWNCCYGQLAPEGLAYLCADPDLVAHASQLVYLTPKQANGRRRS